MKLNILALFALTTHFIISSLNLQIVRANDEDDTSAYIINGKKTNRCNIPYIVKLKIYRSNKSLTFCSGTLLDNFHILTAAHCLKKINTNSTHIDAFLTTKDQPKKIKITKWVIHAGYKYTYSLVNDLAVLILDEPVQYTSCFKPIQLATKEDKTSQVCTISGWGLTKGVIAADAESNVSGPCSSSDIFPVNGTKVSKKLHYANMRIRNPESCEMMGPLDRRYHICAGDFQDGRSNVCKGDSGGPLTCYLPNKKEVQVGISSFIYDCNGNFAVFTNIRTYVDWIEEQMMNN